MSELSMKAESLVCSWLRRHGWSIIARNYRTRRSEIDIIASRDGITSFVEVKYAGDASHTMALEKIDPEKQSRIIHAATVFVSMHPAEGQYRFDVVVVRGSPDDMRVGTYIEDAFRP